MIKKHLKRWKNKVTKSFKKNFPISLISIILILLITYTMMSLVIGFGIIPFLGYLAYSIINLDQLIKHPWKSALWGLIYIALAIITDALLNNALPTLSKGDGASIFSGLILATILIVLWLKIRKLK